MNPKTMDLEKPCMRSENSRAAMARCQKVKALRRREKTLETMPPRSPTKTEMEASKGTDISDATTRGVTSLRLGSVPMAQTAAAWSVTTIETGSEEVPD